MKKTSDRIIKEMLYGPEDVEPVQVITPEEVEENESLFGNYYYGITKEQVEELLAGKVVTNSNGQEYNIFLKLVEEKPMNQKERKRKRAEATLKKRFDLQNPD